MSESVPSVMLIGPGDLGGVLLESLAREPDLGRILVCGRSAGRGEARVNLARLGAIAQGYAPDIHFCVLDLDHREQVAETIVRENPQLILTTATMQTWWTPDMLPRAPADAIKQAGFGVWLPVHLSPTRKLMEALRDAGYRGMVLTAPFPDVVNCVLGKLDLAPTCGIGNVDEIVAKVRWLAARRLEVPLETVQALLVAHHALGRTALHGASEEAPPYLLRIEHEGRDVTREVDAAQLLFSALPVSRGRVTHFLTAGSAVRLVRALLSDSEILVHAPGPLGLPGGYPIRAGSEEVRLALPSGWSRVEAIDVNEQSHRFDGIERIEPDGTVVFSARPAGILREVLGYDCRRLPPADVDERAMELRAKFRTYAGRHGVGLG